jgi:lipid A ethanolaminephosphotransferase
LKIKRTHQLVQTKGQNKGIAVEWLGVLCSVFWAIAANTHFYQKALGPDSWMAPGNPVFLIGLFVLLIAVHSLIIIPLLTARWAKSLLIVLLLATSLAVYFIQHYNVYLDADMLRNAIKSDPAEATEMLSGSMIWPILLYGILPSIAIYLIPIRQSTWGKTIQRRLLILIGLAALAAFSLFVIFQPISSFMRNQKEARYLITPANYLYGLAQVAKGEQSQIALVKEPIGVDAKLRASINKKPKITVIVVAETLRAASWGLSGYARQTTPLLAQANVFNFTDVTSCGTNTETSLPCMFAPVGRRNYDEKKIRTQQSLLHVLAKADLTVRWRDNQSGCKGVCSDLPIEFVNALLPPTQQNNLCEKGGHCKDEGLLEGLEPWLASLQGNHVLVLHPLGSHGPAYFKRYPAQFEQYKPACQSENLRDCTQEQIVNAYDNTILYTDYVFAILIKILNERSEKIDSSLIFVADHGESLGEKNLFLHGMPYAIAPDVQKKVPLFLWFSAGMKRRLQLNETCLLAKTRMPIAHDHLFHTVLTLTNVDVKLYEPQYDILAGCTGTEQ